MLKFCGKIIFPCILTGILTQSCSSLLPPFSSEDREKNPLVQNLKNSTVLVERSRFFDANSSLLDKRRLEIMREHPSLAAGPKLSGADGDRFWWEMLWLQDFKMGFIDQNLHPLATCLETALKKATTSNTSCAETQMKFQNEWPESVRREIEIKVSLRPTIYSLYLQTLWVELRYFDEAYRMQLLKK